MNKIKDFIKKHKYLFLFIKNIILPFQEFYYKYLISDERLLKKIYKKKFGKDLDLKNPKTFNEKLQYLKLIQRDEKFSIMSDKYRVREYVKEKIGEEILVPLYWVGDDPKDIPWNKLPKSFVIKANHDSGSTIIVKDKDNIDKKYVEKFFRYYLKRNFYLYGREYNYKNIPKKIIIEKLLGDNINDYKFFCFNGKPEIVQVDLDRNISHKRSFYDLEWNELNHVLAFNEEIVSFDKKVEKPKNLEKMISYAKILSNELPFSRIDFYEVGNRLYFGEITFYHGSGTEKFYPDHEKWDFFYGEKIKLDHTLFRNSKK